MLVIRNIIFVCCIIFTALITSATANPNIANGFNLSGSFVAIDEILSGGPPKDGIPAIDKPVFIKASNVKNMKGNARVLGVTRNGISKAYPINILNHHEIVNDDFGGEAIAITYCPLCGSGIAFKANIANYTLKFGVSGLLYNSDVLLFDRSTNSLWSQILSKAITGSLRGSKLTRIPIDHTNWENWRKQHPATLVLSQETSFNRDYQNNPYTGYDKHDGLFFPVKFRSKGYHPKEQTFGLKINNKAKAYPFVELSKTSKENIVVIKDEIGGQAFTIHFNKKHHSVQAFDTHGKQIEGVTLYWFAWFTFNPETDIYRAKSHS